MCCKTKEAAAANTKRRRRRKKKTMTTLMTTMAKPHQWKRKATALATVSNKKMKVETKTKKSAVAMMVDCSAAVAALNGRRCTTPDKGASCFLAAFCGNSCSW